VGQCQDNLEAGLAPVLFMGNLAMSTNLPLVTVVTPVYNGQKYLPECIESVLAQTYQNFEYVIVNNCSTDGTLDIAKAYAKQDRRITVHCNDTFVNCEENHNIAFSLIPSQSKYCKVVSADDRIAAECLEKMIALAEAHPAIAMVGSYQQSGETVRWKGLPVKTQVISGREVCRSSFLTSLDVSGDPTSLLYRSDLIRKNQPFFPHSLPHADTSSFYKYLQYYDFGFVHEILSIERVHDQQVSTAVHSLGAGNVATLENFLVYGPMYLNEVEFEGRKQEIFARYYRWLGGNVLKMREKEFWEYHTVRLRELGYPIQWKKVIRATMDEILDEIKNPYVALGKLFTVVRAKYNNCDVNTDQVAK